MSSNNILSKIVNGNTVAYIPKSLDKVDLYIGSEVILPEPNETDAWSVGNFSARVVDCDDKTGDLLICDSDDNFWAVEPDRVIVSEDLSDDEISVLEKEYVQRKQDSLERLQMPHLNLNRKKPNV